VAGNLPIDADLHVDFIGLFLMYDFRLVLGDEILLHEVETV
jgi:hypothetical protein